MPPLAVSPFGPVKCRLKIARSLWLQNQWRVFQKMQFFTRFINSFVIFDPILIKNIKSHENGENPTVNCTVGFKLCRMMRPRPVHEAGGLAAFGRSLRFFLKTKLTILAGFYVLFLCIGIMLWCIGIERLCNRIGSCV